MVAWPEAVVMIIGATIGGYGGAYFARRLDPRMVRWFVIGVGVVMTIYFFVRP
ncbi:MAG: TSUP family transporter [Ktedonobacteraceae bacterium]